MNPSRLCHLAPFWRCCQSMSIRPSNNPLPTREPPSVVESRSQSPGKLSSHCRTPPNAWAGVGAVAHLNAVISSPARCAQHRTAQSHPVLHRAGIQSGIVRALQGIVGGRSIAHDEQRALLAHELKDFRPEWHRARGRHASASPQSGRAGRGQSKFEDNVLDATNAWTHDVPVADLAGVPADVVATAQAKAKEAGLDR